MITEMENYLPNKFKLCRDLLILFETSAQELKQVEQLIDDAHDASFIAKAKLEGIARLEKIMGLRSEPGTTLENRRETVLSKSIGLDASNRFLLEEYCKRTLGDDFVSIAISTTNKSVIVHINLYNTASAEIFRYQLRRLVPANMTVQIVVDSHVTNDVVEDYQHEELEPYSHEFIANSLERR